MEIVIASHNIHKIRELRDLFKSLKQHELISLHHFKEYIPPQEKGKTFQDNASAKAKHAAHHLKKWTLADDSGLVVPALNGSPGIRSKFYAGDDATDSENRKKLLMDMVNLSELQRSAYYECCLALANPAGEIIKIVTGNCEGFVANQEKGRNGFGYDAVFIKNDYEKTFAEIEDATKYRISHRRKAFEKMAIFLDSPKALQ